ncbi:DUF2818 family protein [Herbaspirillum seropedicae]|uniref:Transmembrane protein n=1 Tax=Herbaspirillum seropedicae (strain SmR1) TaxID=757424 RepID=D8IRG9_HERSS|nr:DUF2818 family protein [Herbaspirillum seropedicae]ADJ63293.1 transmembrane protein [Herbaspirillum seropedicae SmR1]AKN65336.1 membrane protein [Herbaspirillum seropedicae]MDR6394905.1 quinol-cytochrome oxidoreductase complex cytochrome b subunit [Herbaspirillum seropedicae]NQE31573.1 membrane protein [Herbaspirillum seropedicae]UMU21302.1 DUF2818 family protein [Herbaspirillum seropedicae]
MNISLFSWVVILLAALAANLPFLNQQLFALIPLKKDPAWVKPVWLRLVELLVLYFVVGIVAHLLEAGVGNVFSQGWEFYAITGCLFLVLAYPGYVMRYLRKSNA